MGGNISFTILIPPLPKLSHNKMEKMIKKGAQAFFLHCYAMEGTTDKRENTDQHELEQILGEHSDIFQNPPRGLLPPRSRDHIIKLIPGSGPIRKN